MTVDKLEAAARALREAAEKFQSPVRLYVEDEARHRFERANPDKDPYGEKVDWELESWKILARAVIAEMREPSEAMREAGGEARDLADEEIGDVPAYWCWQLMIDEALKEDYPMIVRDVCSPG